MGGDSSNSDAKSEVTNDTQIENIEQIKNTQIYDMVNSAFNSSTDVLNEVSSAIDQANEMMAKASGNQSNVIDFTNIEGSKGVMISLDQKNKAKQDVALVAAVQAISDLKVDNTQKAIICDMLGLTNDITNSQGSASSSQQGSAVKNNATSKQTAKFTPYFNTNTIYLE